MNTITDLLATHDVLDYVFFEHQSSLLHLRFSRALELLCEYENALTRHMQYEEQTLLPLYAARVAFPPAGAPQLFLTDHEKMLDFVSAFRSKTAELIDSKEPEEGLILLLDREAFYKRLSAHHDKRERDFLYPMLERQLTENEELSLLHTANHAKPFEVRI